MGAWAGVFGASRRVWDHLAHLGFMGDGFEGLGLEPMLSTTELARYLGVAPQAITAGQHCPLRRSLFVTADPPQ
ncbi:MAG: hypothetical protein LBK59_00230 [Bifidobacteriaceae bacterium]|nr:hypothetical protein [Bifidobacteriaceae bacterium]